MVYAPNTNDLFTTIRNTSGVTMFFGQLPPHGKTLAANESMTFPGNLITGLGAKLSQRKFQALQAALDTHLLTIVSTPAVFLFDPLLDRTRQLALEGHVLGTVEPNWAATSSAFQPAP